MTPARRKAIGERILVLLLQLACVALALGLWQLASDRGWINPVFLSSPTDAWASFKALVRDGQLTGNILSTLKVLGLGWIIGLASGTALGVVMGVSRTANDFLAPFIVFANALPRLLFLPFFIVWLGFGLTPKIALVVVVIVFVVALMIASGVREVGGDLLTNARVLGANRRQLAQEVYFPSILLWLLTSSRTTLGFAFQATVAAELLGTVKGLGYLLTLSQVTVDSGGLFAVLGIMCVLGLLIDTLLGLVERRLTQWMPV